MEFVLDGAVNGTETRRIVGEDVAAAVQAALVQARAQGRRVLAVDTLHPTLEDAVVQLTGLSADVMRVEKGGKGK